MNYPRRWYASANTSSKPELSELTRAYFTAAARYEGPDIAAAMRAFAADPADSKAIAVLRANPATIGKIGTACVVTMVSGGHAANALPQRATANINCRIFPGHARSRFSSRMSPRAALQPTRRPFVPMWLTRSRERSTLAIRGCRYSPRCQSVAAVRFRRGQRRPLENL
jgi:hypothetical protein